MEDYLKRILSDRKRGCQCWASSECKQGATFKLMGTPVDMQMSPEQIKHMLQLPSDARVINAESCSYMCTTHAIQCVEREKAKGNYLMMEELLKE